MKLNFPLVLLKSFIYLLGAECVVCMCDSRDTIILPCRHLCLCYTFADSLRYQVILCAIVGTQSYSHLDIFASAIYTCADSLRYQVSTVCDSRSTIILPCRHLCLCYTCADSLRYQVSTVCDSRDTIILPCRHLCLCYTCDDFITY